MIPVMVAGAGKIGRLIALLLSQTSDYQVVIVDCDLSAPETQKLIHACPNIQAIQVDLQQPNALKPILLKHHIRVIVSSLPFFLNSDVAILASETQAHYFDLTEDNKVTQQVSALAAKAQTAFVPQCGIAPGFISILAHDLMQRFDVCHEAKLRVGALPQQTSNALHYALTWSTDGLINEYAQPCDGIDAGRRVSFEPLEGLESIQIDGDTYEAFNTSGGLGRLAEHYDTKIQYLTYKTIRHPGHCEKMRFLMHTLRLKEDKALLKQILEHAIPRTHQDMLLIYVSVSGEREGTFLEESFIKKLYPKTIQNIAWSAIQLGTASALCAVLDLVMQNQTSYHGLVAQEQFNLNQILKNRFGKVFS